MVWVEWCHASIQGDPPWSCTGVCWGEACRRFGGRRCRLFGTGPQSFLCWWRWLSSFLTPRRTCSGYQNRVLKYLPETFGLNWIHFCGVCGERLVAYPNPKSSMFGGRVDFVHMMNFSMGHCSSSPSSSQSWSPLHTRDWLMHFPEGRHAYTNPSHPSSAAWYTCGRATERWPDLQRKRSPHPSCRGQPFVVTQGLVSVRLPWQGLPPNWA